MANDVVIRAEGLGKKYVIGHQVERGRETLRDLITRNVRGWGHSAREMLQGRPLIVGDETEEFWALKDVAFEIRRGEVVGIIGRNGAGKSTLLKILSRITEPNEGWVKIDGRVASLLEIGTGFHPELTGRENIYLNGAILGMTRTEIRRKFDEIVAFAEVWKFLDTPVKRYSSGMYVRLAFAVAAHLESEILVVDEVLAVGDAEFQKKCLGKMQDVAGGGRTVLFVSHNMAAIRQLCARALVFSNGLITFDGDSIEAISNYRNGAAAGAFYRRLDLDSEKPHLREASVGGISLLEKDNRVELNITLVLSAPRSQCVNLDIRVRDGMGLPVAFATAGAFHSSSPLSLKAGDTEVLVILDVDRLAVGRYTLSFDLTMPWVEYYDRVEDCLEFCVGPEHWKGVLHPLQQKWQYGSNVLPLRLQSPK